MKHILLAIAFFTFNKVGIAQTFSGGIKTGASLWFTKDNPNKKSEYVSGKNVTWDKGFFVRYDSKKRFSLDVSFTHNSLKNDHTKYLNSLLVFDGPYYEKSLLKEENFEVSIDWQLNVTCKKLNNRAILKNISSYIGLSITPVFTSSHFEQITINYAWGGGEKEINQKNVTLSTIFTSFTHTLRYNINQSYYLCSTASLTIDPFRFFNDYYTSPYDRDARANWMIGVGYNF